MPGAVQAVTACTPAPGGWGRGGDGGVARVGYDAAGQGHHACLALCRGTRASHALCDPGGAQALHRLWPGRECGAAGDQSALQGPRVVLDGNDGQWPDAFAGSLQGWTVGRRHDRGDDGHMADAKLCTSESRSNASVGRDPETWHAPIVHQIPKAGSVRCPLFTNAPPVKTKPY